MSDQRNFACMDCGKRASATRRASRCPRCSNTHRQLRLQAWRDARRGTDAPLACAPSVAAPSPEQDLDILAYTAHKQRHGNPDSALTQEAKATFEREMARFAPKRGRPRKVA